MLKNFRKVISFLCIATLILTTLSAMISVNVFAETSDSNIWDGTVATEFAGGDGTEGNPYQIANGAQLALMLTSDANGTKGKFFKITEDIYLNDIESEDWANKTNLNEWYVANVFYGHLDGGNHIVYGMYYSNATDWAALIPHLRSADSGANGATASVKNVGVRHAYVKSNNGGAIIGKVEVIGTSVENCFADETVTLECTVRQGFVAFVNTNGFSMNKCYFTGVLSSTSGAANNSGGGSAGLIGDLGGTADFTGVKVENSYAVTDGKEYDNRVIVKDNKVTKFTFNNVYGNQFASMHNNLTGLTLVSAVANMKGANALTYMSGLDFKNDYMAVKDGYPVLRSFHNGVWDGNVAVAFANGDGTEENPYQITNGAELAYVITAGKDVTEGKFFKITEDIYLNDVTKADWKIDNPNTWYSGKTFYGSLDGDYHTVYGIYYADDAKNFAGLIPVLEPTDAGAIYVKNIAVKDSYIVGERAGGLIGKVNSSLGATVENCFVDETVSLKGTNAEGGLISWISGYYNIIFRNCYSKATFSGNASQGDGGLLGYLFLSNEQIETMASENKHISFLNCYAITEGDVPVSYSSSITVHLLYSDSYGNIGEKEYLPGMTILADMNSFYGRNAYSNMIFFDFTGFVPQWNDTPVLRGFYDFTEYDVNADGEKNANDTVLLIKYLLNLDDETLDFAAADACNDGKINIVDLVALKNYIASI